MANADMLTPTQRPLRAMDRYAADFWKYTESRELRVQKCEECGNLRFPPGPACDNCLSERFEWAQLSGSGTVLSWTVFHRTYFQEYPAPHVVFAVELDEGIIILSNAGAAPFEPEVGQRVQVVWESSCDKFGTYNLPVFQPAE